MNKFYFAVSMTYMIIASLYFILSMFFSKLNKFSPIVAIIYIVTLYLLLRG